MSAFLNCLRNKVKSALSQSFKVQNGKVAVSIPCLVLDGADEVVALQLLPVGDGHDLHRAGARRLHDHLHLHGGQHRDRLALFHVITLFHLYGWNKK